MGVTSGFNIDDINDYINIGGASIRAKDPAYRMIRDRIERIGLQMFWVPSMKTLRKIEEQINNQRRLQQREHLDYS